MLKHILYEDLAKQFDYWLQTAVSALADKHTDTMWMERPEAFARIRNVLIEQGISKNEVEQVLSEVLRGQIVSILVSLDGGTALAETERVFVVDKHGEGLSNDLHTGFVSHLIDTDRLE